MWSYVETEIVVKLLLAAGLGAAVGLERELKQKPAGLRTNMFICVGSTLFTLLSFEFAEHFGGDPGRIAAQIISGIGFIGAGAIIRERGSIGGLTTAATIFVNAGIGMAVGAGFYPTAILTTALALIVLLVVGRFEARFTPRPEVVFYRLQAPTLDAVVPQVREAAREKKVSLQRVRSYRQGEDYVFEFDAALDEAAAQDLFERLRRLEARCEMSRVESSRS